MPATSSLLAVQLPLLLLASVGASTSGAISALEHKSLPRGYCAPIRRAIPAKSACFEHLVAGTPAHLDPEEWLKKNKNSDGAGKTSHRSQHSELVYVRVETLGSKLANLSTVPINERILVGVIGQLFGDPRQTTDLSAGRASAPLTSRKLAQQQQHELLEEVRAQISDGAGRQASRCREALERLVCRLVYPTCHFRRKDVSALVRPPCREDCLLVRDVFCANLDWIKLNLALRWALNSTLATVVSPLGVQVQGGVSLEQPQSTSHLRDGSPIPSLHGLVPDTTNSSDSAPPEHLGTSSMHLYWPHEHSLAHCDSLPALKISPNVARLPRSFNHLVEPSGSRIETPDKETHWSSLNELVSEPSPHPIGALVSNHPQQRQWPICASAHLTSTSSRFVAKLDCVEPEGVDYEYLGQMNKTRSGLACQEWRHQQPHEHTSSELLFDSMSQAHNYCRNPGSLESQPWCYTQDEKVRWEYCDIKQCSS